MKKDIYNSKYRISTTRLSSWDYKNRGYYFVTLCTKNKKNIFGIVVNNKIVLSKIGIIVNKYWNEIPYHYNNAKLDTSIVMPNHIHGIIIICRDGACPVSTNNRFNIIASQRPVSTLGNIIGSFKSAVKRDCNKNKFNFHWQPRFYDHIIRNEISLHKIRNYIQANPYCWNIDEENPDNVL